MTVEELLKSKDVYFIPKGADALVRCLNPEHDDRNPSMRIDRILAYFSVSPVGIKETFLRISEKRRTNYN